MMDLDSAIQHCKEQVQEQAKKGCYSCAEEHQQLAEWLKDYKRLLGESCSEIPNTCGDAISRQSAIFLASDLKQDLPDDERIADMVMAHNEGILEYQTQLSLLPSVTPQQRAEVLDKIRAEIDEQYDRVHPYDISCAEGLEMALGIIDKYKAESEEQE